MSEKSMRTRAWTTTFHPPQTAGETRVTLVVLRKKSLSPPFGIDRREEGLANLAETSPVGNDLFTQGNAIIGRMGAAFVGESALWSRHDLLELMAVSYAMHWLGLTGDAIMRIEALGFSRHLVVQNVGQDITLGIDSEK